MYSMKQFCEKVGLHRTTVLRLEELGIIKPLRTPGGVRRFTDEHVRQVFAYYGSRKPEASKKKTVIYARVSTNHQKEFLKNQIEACKQFCAAKGWHVDEVITDTASSFNFGRKGLQRLLDLVTSSSVERVVVFDADRLSRIAFNFFDDLFKRFGAQVIVVDQALNSPEKLDEVTQELISFIHYITSKIYGRRRYRDRIKSFAETEPVEMEHETRSSH